jgi:DNA-binding XRE family transcriptional regulator
MIITVNEYLNQIKEMENRKPEAQRRSLPTQAEFARAAGVNRQAFHQWLKKPSLNEKYFDTIITKMRAYGFNTDVADLVRYEQPSGV